MAMGDRFQTCQLCLANIQAAAVRDARPIPRRSPASRATCDRCGRRLSGNQHWDESTSYSSSPLCDDCEIAFDSDYLSPLHQKLDQVLDAIWNADKSNAATTRWVLGVVNDDAEDPDEHIEYWLREAHSTGRELWNWARSLSADEIVACLHRDIDPEPAWRAERRRQAHQLDAVEP